MWVFAPSVDGARIFWRKCRFPVNCSGFRIWSSVTTRSLWRIWQADVVEIRKAALALYNTAII
jgi:hypothetical protein